MELLQGTDLENLSRRHRVTAATFSVWRDDFVGQRRSQLHAPVTVEAEETRRPNDGPSPQITDLEYPISSTFLSTDRRMRHG